ncbi:hypothetical protein RclHR1_01280002 [Rhizophagus clarus]|uniref:Uncharacterized protein n=1 Tax=Rhizophagus clarus TaxID=94130 RepID=A0A2Z6Q9X3_9GLOM|nr:hypothetical protein RclHR1_01280002 [Rhizophagus clarus]GES76389.1 hypothetical protein RCL_jg26268.t1 [Rhizophagus clarus]
MSSNQIEKLDKMKCAQSISFAIEEVLISQKAGDGSSKLQQSKKISKVPPSGQADTSNAKKNKENNKQDKSSSSATKKTSKSSKRKKFSKSFQGATNNNQLVDCYWDS